MTSTIPEIGDRITVYHYTPVRPTDQQIKQWIEDPWAFLPAADHNKLRLWGDWAIVVLRRSRKGDRVWLTVTSEEFAEPLRSQGVRVPLTHVEMVEKGYGLPLLGIAPVGAVVSLEKTIVVEQRSLL